MDLPDRYHPEYLEILAIRAILVHQENLSRLDICISCWPHILYRPETRQTHRSNQFRSEDLISSWSLIGCMCRTLNASVSIASTPKYCGACDPTATIVWSRRERDTNQTTRQPSHPLSRRNGIRNAFKLLASFSSRKQRQGEMTQIIITRVKREKRVNGCIFSRPRKWHANWTYGCVAGR